MSWIKIEHALPDKPEVLRMSEILKLDPDMVVGKLLRFWLWCDQQTITGTVPVSQPFIDRITFQPGFSDALLSVGWLQVRSGSLVIPHFDRHNGQTAKARAMDNRKKASQRERAKPGDRHPEDTGTNVPIGAGQKPGPEKRREEDILRESARAGEGVQKTEPSGGSSDPGTPTTPEIPTLEQVKAYALMPTAAIPATVAVAYFDKMEACGWKDQYNRPVENWRADLRHYHRCKSERRAATKTARGGAPSSFGGDLMHSYVGTARTAANDPDLANFLPATGGQK